MSGWCFGGFCISPLACTLMSSLEACGIREPKAETKELLLEKARTLAKQAAEMSGGADAGHREYYYGASNFNPDIPAFTPPQGPLASPTSNPAANGSTQPQPTPPTTKFTLNPDSKAFVPSGRVPHLTPKLKAGPASFIPPSQPTAPQPTEGATAVTAETETLSMVGLSSFLLCLCTRVCVFRCVAPYLFCRCKIHIITRILKFPLEISRVYGCSKKNRNKWWHLSTLTHHISLRIRNPKSPRVHSGPLYKAKFRTSDPQRNVMGQSTEMSPLVSMLFQTFLNPLKFLTEIFDILLWWLFR